MCCSSFSAPAPAAHPLPASADAAKRMLGTDDLQGAWVFIPGSLDNPTTGFYEAKQQDDTVLWLSGVPSSTSLVFSQDQLSLASKA